MLGQTMGGGELMSTPASAFRVHQLLCYKALEKKKKTYSLNVFPSSPLIFLFDISAMFSISLIHFFSHPDFFIPYFSDYR